MVLRNEPDISHADWFIGAADDWRVLATQGPPGYEAYCLVRFDGDDADPYRDDAEIMATVVALAADHTRTADDVFFGLWDGWGELTEAGRAYPSMRSNWLRDLWFRPSPPRVRPAFDESVIDGPKVNLRGDREYLLFRGAVADVGAWGARPYDTDLERTLPPASLTWPADRAWFIAADVDPSWMCVGGARRLIDELLAHPDLVTDPATHGVIPPLDPVG